MATVRYEQAVYGSFPFWDRGYDVLACSPGCRPEWLAELKGACQRLGEKPAGAGKAGGLFALRLPGGPWAVVGVEELEADDRGRHGALAFHALFVRPRDYARDAGGSPFGLAGALRTGWSADVRALPAGVIEVGEGASVGVSEGRAARIAAAIARGRRVYLESAGPIDGLAREVWGALPARVRRRASVATWAFGAGNRFDLVALPRVEGVAFDASYRDAAALEEAPGAAKRWPRRAVVAAGAGLVMAGGMGLAMLRRGSESADPSTIAPEVQRPRIEPPPPRTDDPDDRPLPGDRGRVAEGLVDLADRCGVPVAGREDDPTALMARLAERLRYRGPLLSAEDRARLRAEPAVDRERALGWDAKVRRFLPDRPLPEDFARRSLRGQLRLLAWSFHVPGPGGPTAEMPVALAEALAVDAPARPGPLAGRYPALAEYARFLDRLPRK